MVEKLLEFRETYFPELIVENKNSNIVNGVAASYYGVSSIGAAIHRCKYEKGGDFPDFLLKLTLKAFRKQYGKQKFHYICYVPPTESGDLVKNFAEKLASVLNIPISHKLKKNAVTKPQKVFQNGYLKKDNVRRAFEYGSPLEIRGKSILLFDDIFDSGSTMKEIGTLLTNYGVSIIAPLVIAKTVGGDI
jgi:ATP-dependent DNA helicase RecQ